MLEYNKSCFYFVLENNGYILFDSIVEKPNIFTGSSLFEYSFGFLNGEDISFNRIKLGI